MKKALIAGVTGQDGACLAEFLLGKGYVVHGIKRLTSVCFGRRSGLPVTLSGWLHVPPRHAEVPPFPEVLMPMRTGDISTGGWQNTLMLKREVLRACREHGITTSLSKMLSKPTGKPLEFIRR